MGDANEIYYNSKNKYLKVLAPKKILKNIWDRTGMDTPIGPYIDFFCQSDNSKEEHNFWRRYEINEKKYRSIFLNQEKIKVVNIIILKNVNIMKLMKRQFITLQGYFPCHDPY